MEIQNQSMNQSTQKKNIKLTSLISGGLILLIPIVVGTLIMKPELLDLLMQSRADIMQGLIIGVSILPVFLFIGIKAGEEWYQKAWAWTFIAVACIAIVGLTLQIESSTGHRPMMQEMYMRY